MDEKETRELNILTSETSPPAKSTMVQTSSELPAPVPSWFTPKRLLVIFCMINLINYIDRGSIASNGVNGNRGTCSSSGVCTAGNGIQGEFNLNNFEDGILSSAFMVGLLVASPLFASLAKSFNPFRLIGVGLSVWTLAIIGCGFSFSFWSIALCRMIVGVGEASFISLAAPFIDDNAPADQKTAWLGIFYMCIPSGYALGYEYGGFIGSHYSWRFSFWGEAILMIPFAVLGFILKPLQLKGFSLVESKKAIMFGAQGTEVSFHKQWAFPLKTQLVDKNAKKSSKLACICSVQLSRFIQEMGILITDKVYLVGVIGYILYNFVIGAYSYWGPKAGHNIYNMNNADTIFGAITLGCGIFGTVGGGYFLDLMDSTISNAFKLLAASTFIGAAFCFSAFSFKSMHAFLVIFAIGELLVFAVQGPVNYVFLHCVKPSMRPLSMAISTVSIHVFGDVPSSPLVGILQDNIKNWRMTALTLTSIWFPAAFVWFLGIFLHNADKSDEENKHQEAIAERTNTTPLLDGNAIPDTETDTCIDTEAP